MAVSKARKEALNNEINEFLICIKTCFEFHFLHKLCLSVLSAFLFLCVKTRIQAFDEKQIKSNVNHFILWFLTDLS